MALNVNRLVAREIKQSGIFNGEASRCPCDASLLAGAARARRSRRVPQRRSFGVTRFQRIYPRLIRCAIIVGIAVPIIVLASVLLGMTKVVLLTLFLGWTAFVFVFLIVVESLRSSFERQLRLDKMSDEQLRELYRRAIISNTPTSSTARPCPR